MNEMMPIKRGGYRKGAGRPPNTGKYGEPTVPVRVPISLLDTVQALVEECMKNKNNPKTTIKFEDK